MPLIYQNPLPIKNIGDPFVLRAYDGTCYCYATSAPDGFKAWSSPDLVHWTDLGYVYKRNENSWGKSDFGAPEVVLYQSTGMSFSMTMGASTSITHVIRARTWQMAGMRVTGTLPNSMTI